MERFEDRAIFVVHEFIGGGSQLSEALRDIAIVAVDALGTKMAGLTLNSETGRPRTVVHTNGAVAEIDQAQYDADAGPCLEAFRTRRTVMVADIASDERFPKFAAAAVHHGIHSSLSVPLVVGGRGIGALNFYDEHPDGFDDDANAAATLFARHAAVVAAYFDRADEADNLQRAMQTRAVIEQAKGIIMGSTGCSPDDAFEILRQQSQAENRKLHEIATLLVEQQRRERGSSESSGGGC